MAHAAPVRGAAGRPAGAADRLAAGRGRHRLGRRRPRLHRPVSSGFGVAAVGHRNPRVVAAVHRQADLLLHGLGDLHPTDVRARLAERLAGLAPFGLTRMLFQLTGAGAVELALKTAHLATGRAGRGRVRRAATTAPGWARWPPAAGRSSAIRSRRGCRRPGSSTTAVVPRAGRRSVACVVVEPMQGRGGVVEPPSGFLAGLRDACDRGRRPAGGGRGVHRPRAAPAAMWMCQARGRAARPAGMRQGAGRRPAAVGLPGRRPS